MMKHGKLVSHFRPCHKDIDEKRWLEAFQSSQARAGKYVGALMLQIPYQISQFSQDERHLLTVPLSVSLNYQPSHLHRVDVKGNGVMNVSDASGLISASTDYQITASGYFHQGVKIGIMPIARDGIYRMQSLDPNNHDEILYNVTCTQGCEGQRRLIQDGIPQLNDLNQQSLIKANQSQRANATILHFNQQNLVKNDTYQGKFALVFSAPF